MKLNVSSRCLPCSKENTVLITINLLTSIFFWFHAAYHHMPNEPEDCIEKVHGHGSVFAKKVCAGQRWKGVSSSQFFIIF